MELPKTYSASSAPSAVLSLVERIVPQLISGDHPAHVVLREQFRRARIREVALTGCGFFVEFDIPQEVPLTEPLSFAGGNAEIALEGSPTGAGCVLFVRDGRLAMFEGYSYGDELWSEHTRVLAVTNVQPVRPDDAA
jgi:hypothetical protein